MSRCEQPILTREQKTAPPGLLLLLSCSQLDIRLDLGISPHALWIPVIDSIPSEGALVGWGGILGS